MSDVELPLPFEAYSGDEPYIFASYAHNDGQLVFSELQALCDKGFRIWYDEGIDPGNEWPDEIADALNRAVLFLVFVSKSAVQSRNVRNEINFALNRGKPFLAIHLERIDLPPGLELRMGGIQAIMKWRMTEEHYSKKLISSLPRSARETLASLPPPEHLAGGDSRTPYSQEIARATPACFLFVIDQSLSMEDPLGGTHVPKCEILADAINGWIENMIIKSSGDKGIKDWVEIAVIGYHTDEQGVPVVKSALAGNLANQGFLPIGKLNENPLRVVEKIQQIFDAESGEKVEFAVSCPVWVDPVHRGGTPMCHALFYVHGMIEKWIMAHRNCHPPIVMHFTDGESQDGDPCLYAEPIRNLSTHDGNVLMFNCHLSCRADEAIIFPASIEVSRHYDAHAIFEMSSVLPEPVFNRAIAEGVVLQPGAKGFVFNADAAALAQFLHTLSQFLDMGTRVAKNLR